MSNTPYMNLVLPTVSVTLGPLWATEVNSAFTLIDSHNHTTGAGNPLPLSSLLLSDLDFDGFSINNLSSIGLATLTVAPSILSSIYFKAGEFYIIDGSGNEVQITSGGAVNFGTTGSIVIGGGAGNQTFVYTEPTGAHSGRLTLREAATEFADLSGADVLLHQHAAGITEFVRLKSPAALASTYSLTMPSAVPASTSLLTISSTGVLAPSLTPTITSLILNTIQIITGGSTGKIARSDAAGNFAWADVLPIGTVCVFYQATAPLGWTRVVGFDTNGNFLRVVNVGGGTAGVSYAGLATDNTTHYHGDSFVVGGVDDVGGDLDYMSLRNTSGTVVTHSYFGFGNGTSYQGQHSHHLTGSVGNNVHFHTIGNHTSSSHVYADVCICSKDA